jgi:predicted phosphodiesterase
MELLLVHLTDIHIRDDEDLDVLSARTDSIGGAICNHITNPSETEVIFCVTGDLVFSGKDDQYAAAGLILDEIYSLINKRYPKVGIHSVFVPGNHDCDFDAPEEEVREPLLISPALDISKPSALKACTAIQKNFYVFGEEWDKKHGAMFCDDDKILTVNELNFDSYGVHLKFHCINTSWCSKKHEEKGKMKITTGKMSMVTDFLEKKPDDIVIIMMHHDAEWLDWDDKEVWNKYHKQYSDIILVGHDHSVEYTLKENYDKTVNYFIKGNQLYDKYSPNQSGFNILKLNTNAGGIQECFFTYEWDGTIYKQIIDTGYRLFDRNKYVESGIELKEDVWTYLEDLDIDIFNKNGKRELKLSDVFGFPTLKEERNKVTKFFRSMDDLLTYMNENPYISIRGEKEYGKTALLKQIFETYFKQKKFPVFLDITKINSADGEILNKIIAKQYEETYINISADKIMQKAPEDRICIIDNFEEILLGDKSSKKFLKYLTDKFGGVILSRNPKLDLINPLSYVATNDFIEENFHILFIHPAKGSYRERIINKWLLLENEDLEEDTPVFDAKRREKYAQVQTVMKGNFFNKTPIDLLLVLSYLGQDEEAQIDYSRYSFIYEKHILEKLNAIGEKTTKTIEMYKTLLQNIAYKMFKDKIYGYVQDSYIYTIILEYKEKHSGMKIAISKLIERMVDYRFLENKGDTYRFKYSYMYFYFAGSYIAKKMNPEKRAEVIKEVFDNIDNDLNYNIALFLAYNLSIEYDILPIVSKMSDSLLTEFKDFKYENVRALIAEWGGNIEKKIERIYTVPENDQIPLLRSRKLQEQEKAEGKREESTDLNEEFEENNSSGVHEEMKQTNQEVLKVGRLVDYVGNILKNYSGGMENPQREFIIDVMFKSVTKVLGSFCNYSTYTVDKLIDMLEEKIKDGDEETIQAKSDFIQAVKMLISEIWLQFVSANVTALSFGLESEDIKENINDYCLKNQTDLVKMTRVEYLIRIASTHLPVSDIRDLYSGKNCLEEVSQNIFKNNIYRYLSNYQFDNKDRQAICSLLGFNIKNILLDEQKLIVASDK